LGVDYDVAVIGLGWGGLGATLTLAEQGRSVIAFETLNYAGGCASTFRRFGHVFESGATLFSGFGPKGLFRQWIDKHALDVTFDPLTPIVTFQTPNFTLAITSDRTQLVRDLGNLAPNQRDGIEAFFSEQEQVASCTWSLLDDPSLLPPFDWHNLQAHLRASHTYMHNLLPLLGRTIESLLRKHRVYDCAPLRTYLDGVCQITIQTPALEAEAIFALSSMDYFFRGTGHVRGGIGTFAKAIAERARTLGADLCMPDAVLGIDRSDGGFRIRSRKHEVRARKLIANVLPQAYAALRGGLQSTRLSSLTERVEQSWGAAMLYLVLPEDIMTELGSAPSIGRNDESAHHFELVADEASALIEGNHVFVSISEPHRSGTETRVRTATLSTHLRARRANGPAGATYVAAVQAAMRATCNQHLPALLGSAKREFTASPRTFERFTGRPMGMVGGPPRSVGLFNYAQLGPCEVESGAYLVGDSIFPGQSTLATALGGVRTAVAVK
jgi:phytoene dehydrogenase-like protein